MRIQDRLVVVTGASSGIGEATARALVRKHPRGVVLIARSADKLGALADEMRGRGCPAFACPFDLSKTSEIGELVEIVREEAGDPDVVINNAGAGRWMFLESTSAAEILDMTAVPYLAAACLTAGFLPAMLERREGHIVNVSSPACLVPWAGATAYSVARFAMRGLSEALRQDLTGTGVGVSLVVPGKVSSEYFSHNPGSEERIPGIARLYRTLSPADVAALIVRAIEKRRFLVVSPLLLRMTVGLHRHLPWMVEPLVRMTGVKR